MAMLSVTTILLLALLASIAFPQFRTALIWLTVAIIVFLAYISDSILQQRFDDQQTTQPMPRSWASLQNLRMRPALDIQRP